MNKIFHGDSLEILKTLPDGIVNTCVTSPPYWGLRDYGVEGQLGLEKTPEEYVSRMVELFREVRRVLHDDGTLWLNLGDSYAKNGFSGCGDPTAGNRNLGGMRIPSRIIPDELKRKDLIGIPWRVAFALQADGWYLRSDIIWNKPNAMPESVRDRPTMAHEYIFLLAKSEKYYYDSDSIKESVAKSTVSRMKQNVYKQSGSIRANGGERNDRPMKAVGNGETRNKRTVWNVPTVTSNKTAHFAVYPPRLIEPCILAGCPEGGIVLDPFFGSGTTGKVARKHNRDFIGIELNEEYIEIAKKQLENIQGVMF